MHETVRVKPKVHWRPHRVRDDKNVEFLPRKESCKPEGIQSKREALWVPKALWMGDPNPLVRNILPPLCPVCYAVYGATELNVYSFRFWSCVGLVLCVPLFLLFGMGVFPCAVTS